MYEKKYVNSEWRQFQKIDVLKMKFFAGYASSRGIIRSIIVNQNATIRESWWCVNRWNTIMTLNCDELDSKISLTEWQYSTRQRRLPYGRIERAEVSDWSHENCYLDIIVIEGILYFHLMNRPTMIFFNHHCLQSGILNTKLISVCHEIV